MTSPVLEEQTTSRKRARVDNSRKDGAVTGAKKGRGRPRVDAHDATAADRRRTQIRLAQRAYRQRKETTIASLRAKNAHLQATIEQMNKTFAGLRKSTIESDLLRLNPSLSQDFNLADESFTALAKGASEGVYEEDDENGEAGEVRGDADRMASHPIQRPNLPQAEHQEVGWGYSIHNRESGLDSAQAAQANASNFFSRFSTYGQPDTPNQLMRRRQFTVGEVLDQSRSSQSTPNQEPTILPFGIVDLLSSQPFNPPSPSIYSVHVPSPELPPPMAKLPTPYYHLPNPLTLKNLSVLTTRSLDATSFSMRLSRAAAEIGFQLLIAAEARPAAMSYVFKFSLPYLTPDQLLARFKMLVSREAGDSLDAWDIPYIQLGGAGTHFPRRDVLGQVQPIKNCWKVQQIGPSEENRARLTNVADGRWRDLECVNLTGFEGVWFDAHDVQCYLEERYGCKLHTKSSFIECVFGEEDHEPFSLFQRYDSSPSLSHKSTSTTPSTSAAITPPSNAFGVSDAPLSAEVAFSHMRTQSFPADFPKLDQYDMAFDHNLGLNATSGYDAGLLSGHVWNRDFNMEPGLVPRNEDMVPPVRQKRKKKKAWVDVHKLIDELLKNAICLGRAPGFRKSDVQESLQKALVRAW